MDDDRHEFDELDALAAEFLDRRRRGETPSVEEFAARYPARAGEIRDLLATVAAMEGLKLRGELSSGGRASLGPVTPERLGEFRLIRPIGRGGMGVVYEALQESLGRRVALKILPRQGLLDERHLARFQRESRIASALHHTNIVQVYGVGEQDGFHYYVMQYVRGEGLDRVMAHLVSPGSSAEGDAQLLGEICRKILGPELSSPLRRPEYYRATARIALQAAEALAYAHAQGTLHRDVKPANLLVDDQGVVWVADFGLARAAGAPQVTQTGGVTGTLRYMAPERLRGQADERGDIYSLGLTLYELATLRPAHAQTDPAELIHEISRQPPARPGKVNPAVPKDLETVILKAIARESEHRYASAGALANDLRRFLEDRPVLARPIGPGERLWRWCRRNRALAALSAATLLSLLAVAGVATGGYLRTRAALDREALQRQRAEGVAKLALDAVDRVFARLGPARSEPGASITVGAGDGGGVEIASQVVPSKETAALLEEMLPFYDRLAGQTGDDLALQRRAADATRRIGDIRQRLGQYEQAASAYRKAGAMYSDLAPRAGEDETLPLLIAQTWNDLGKTFRLAGRTEDARAAHRDALVVLSSLADKSAATAAARLELARTYYLLGARVAANPGARPPGPEGRRPPREPGQAPPGAGEPVGPPRPGPEPGRPDPDRRKHLDQAVALLNGLLQDQPASPACRHLLALCYRDMPPGSNGYDKAVELLTGLAGEFPGAVDYQFDLCQTYAAEVRPPAGQGPEPPGAQERLGKALEISRELLRRQPKVPEYLASQSHIYHKLGAIARRMRRPDEAEQYDRKAVELQAGLAREFPDVAAYQVWLAAFRTSLADTLIEKGKPDEARDVLETSIAQTQRLLQGHPAMWYLHALLMDSNRSLAAAWRRVGRTDQADQADAQAQVHRSHLGTPGTPER